MTNDSQLIPREPERLEEIVSYLDGEMSAEESARVEQRLATDEAFRQELQSIDRAWAALDELPLTTVEDRFAKTTMEMVVQNARSAVDQRTLALPIQRRNRKLRDVLLVATAVLLGSLVFRASWKNPNGPLLADLVVIQNVDIYSQFREVDFLRQLSHRVPSEAWPTDSEQLAEDMQPSLFAASSGDADQWLANLAEGERLLLRAKYNRFRALPAVRQARLRELHEEIGAAEDAEQLRQTMFQYQHWLGSLPASEQYELRELTAEQRVKRIMDMLRQHATSKSLELTPEELQVFFEKMKNRLERERKRLLEKMSPQEKLRFGKMPGIEQRKYLTRKLMREAGQRGERFPALVRDLVPEDKRQAFRKLPLERKRQCFANWMEQAVMQGSGNHSRPGRHFGAEISEQELEKYFTELDAAEIERLLALPRDKMQRQLERRVRGGMTPGEKAEFFDRDRGPPRRRGPPHAGGERRGGRPGGLHDRREDRPGPPDGRPGGPPFGRERDRRSPPEDV